MVYPEFKQFFNDKTSNPCVIKTRLVTNTQPASATTFPVPFFNVLGKNNGKHKLRFNVGSNQQVRTYDGENVDCDLSDKDVNECIITYRIEVFSLTN